MKIIIMLLLILCGIEVNSQIIALPKVLQLTHRPFTEVSDSLILNGWQYAGVDSSQNYKDAEAIVWAYKFDKKKNDAQNWLITFRTYKGDTVDHITQELTPEAYIEYIRILPQLHFEQDKAVHKDGVGLTKTYWRHASMVEIKSYLRKGANGLNETVYAVGVVKVMEDEEYIKAAAKHKKQ